MIDYLGQACIVCHQNFNESDDIVVCPECGTPYHRECYQKEGRCINDTLHTASQSWQVVKQEELLEQKRAEKRAEEAEQAAQRIREQTSGYPNATLYDGVRMNNDPCLGLDPTEEMDGVTIKEMSSFIATNRFFYLPLFRLMKQTGKKISFNLTCLFFPHLYFANRKMWAMAIFTILANFLIRLPSTLSMVVKQFGLNLTWIDIETKLFSTLISVTGIADLVFSLTLCFFSNYFYYRFAIRKIKAYKKCCANETELHETLKRNGGTSFANIIFALVIQMAFSFALSIFLIFVR